MFRVESYRRVAYAISYSLSVILAALNTYNDEVRPKSCFELPQLRKYVDAVDSPIGPEIEQYCLSSQVDQAERLAAGVDPIDVFRKFRRSYRRGRGKFSCHTFQVKSEILLA